MVDIIPKLIFWRELQVFFFFIEAVHIYFCGKSGKSIKRNNSFFIFLESKYKELFVVKFSLMCWKLIHIGNGSHVTKRIANDIWVFMNCFFFFLTCRTILQHRIDFHFYSFKKTVYICLPHDKVRVRHNVSFSFFFF